MRHRLASGVRSRGPALRLCAAVATICVSCTAFVASAGFATAGAAGKGGLVDFANGTENGTTYLGLQHTLQSTLKKVGGYTLHIFNNNYNETQTFSNLTTMISEHPKVIVEYNPLADASSRVGQQLKSSGIPCIAPNVPIPGCYFFNEALGPMGKQLATTVKGLMKAKGWTGSNTEVVLVEIATLGTLNTALYDFYAPLSHQVAGMTPVGVKTMNTSSNKIGSDGLQINPPYTESAADHQFASLLASVPSSENLVVDCLGDETCLGAYKALQSAGRLSNAMLMAWGTTPPAMSLLRKAGSSWVAESANFFAYWGEFIGAEVVAINKGMKPPKQTFPPMTILTKKNVNTYFKANGDVKVFPHLVKADNYLLRTGVLQKLHNVQGIK